METLQTLRHWQKLDTYIEQNLSCFVFVRTGAEAMNLCRSPLLMVGFGHYVWSCALACLIDLLDMLVYISVALGSSRIDCRSNE